MPGFPSMFRSLSSLAAMRMSAIIFAIASSFSLITSMSFFLRNRLFSARFLTIIVLLMITIIKIIVAIITITYTITIIITIITTITIITWPSSVQSHCRHRPPPSGYLLSSSPAHHPSHQDLLWAPPFSAPPQPCAAPRCQNLSQLQLELEILVSSQIWAKQSHHPRRSSPTEEQDHQSSDISERISQNHLHI